MEENATIFMYAFKKLAQMQLPVFSGYSNESIQNAFSIVWDNNQINALWLALLKDKVDKLSNGKVFVEVCLPDDSVPYIHGPFLYFKLISGNKVIKVIMIKEIKQVSRNIQPFLFFE